MRYNTGFNSGLGFCELLAVLFIGLKLCGVIDWSWFWVLSPIWIPISIGAIILIAFGIFYCVRRI